MRWENELFTPSNPYMPARPAGGPNGATIVAVETLPPTPTWLLLIVMLPPTVPPVSTQFGES